MSKLHAQAPEHTVVRVALWRALHVQLDSKPMRASIVGRARFIEDLVEEQTNRGVTQYVILGAGLDTFAQRQQEITRKLHIFEIDQPGPQAWKRKRLLEIGYNIHDRLHFVPVNFEAHEPWWNRLVESGFDVQKPAVVVSTGVSMYLSKEAFLLKLLSYQRKLVVRGRQFSSHLSY